MAHLQRGQLGEAAARMSASSTVTCGGSAECQASTEAEDTVYAFVGSLDSEAEKSHSHKDDVYNSPNHSF